MKLLLDTHAFLWLVEGDSRLGATASQVISDAANQLFLSVASIWELAIKTGGGKLSLDLPLEVFVPQWSTTYQISILTIEPAHAYAVAALPAHHRDPFDRMLIAQAFVEGMTLLSVDPVFKDYAAPVLW